MVAGIVVVLALPVAWLTSVDVRCKTGRAFSQVYEWLPLPGGDRAAPGLESSSIDAVGAVVSVSVKGTRWVDAPDGVCERVIDAQVDEVLWSVDELPVPGGSRPFPEPPGELTAIMFDSVALAPGSYDVFLGSWDPETAELSGLPTIWWAYLVFDVDQEPVAGLDDVALDELASMAGESGVVQTLIEFRGEQVEWWAARYAGEPAWEVGPRTETLLKFRGEQVRDFIGSPELDVWLAWDPLDRRLGWTRSHIPEGAADALGIEWNNGEVVVIHHSLTSDSVTHVGLLSSVGLTGPEPLVPGGGEVSVRGQYARATPLTLLLFDAEGDIALTYPVPESILRALDQNTAVAVDLDLRGAQNWRALDRPPN